MQQESKFKVEVILRNGGRILTNKTFRTFEDESIEEVVVCFLQRALNGCDDVVYFWEEETNKQFAVRAEQIDAIFINPIEERDPVTKLFNLDA